MRRTTASAALVLTLLAAGCGDSGSGGNDTSLSAMEVVQLASTKASEQGTAKFSLSMTLPGATKGAMNAEGAVEFKTSRMRMEMDMAGLMPGGGKMEMLSTGTIIYMKFPAGSIPVPTPWVKMDLAALSQQQGVDIAALQQFGGGNDPSAILQFLRGASDDVKEAGSETVRGVKTTKYTATVDLTKATKEAPDAVKKSVEAAVKQMGASTMPVTVWIDADGLTRRMTMAIKAPASTGAPAGSMNMTMEFYEFGTDVDVDVPPADQVTDFAELMGQMGK